MGPDVDQVVVCLLYFLHLSLSLSLSLFLFSILIDFYYAIV